MLYRLLLFLLCSVTLAQAQDKQSAIDKRLAGEGVFLNGMKEFMAENYAQASNHFEKVVKDYDPTAGAYHMLSKSYLEQKEYSKAEIAARESLKLDKNNTFYQEYLAKIEVSLQNHDVAIDSYKKLIKENPLRVQNYLELADIYVSLGEFKDAIKIYDEVEKNLGIDEEISHRKQMLYLRQDNVEEAIKEGDKLIESQPLESEYVLKQAQIMIGNKKYADAEKLLKNHLEKSGDLGEAHVMLAEVYRATGDIEACNQELTKAFENPLLDAEVKLEILGTFVSLVNENPVTSQIDQAIQLTETILDQNPEKSAGYIYLADLQMKKGNLESARSNYLKSTRFDKSHYEVWMAIVEIDTQLGDIPSLIKHAQEAADYFPNQAFFWYHLGYGNFLARDFNEAIYALEEAQFLSFNNETLSKHIHTLMGDSYAQMKEYADAERAYNSALEIDPNYIPALNNASYYLAIQGKNLEKAEQMAKKLIELEPKNLEFNDTYAWVLFKKGNYQGAEAHLRPFVISGNVKNGTALEHYGDILSKLQRPDEALQFWNLAKNSKQHSPLLDKKIEQKLYLVE
ncbi:tetratricopeptide repeat protein [Jiulongibacter sp. NS-SX5]|uniref:tetratricopeptide repeat protein n=1 Tax=Jiulongibacter sp. NS-SX5 TaxID=3463854 RepID=UPI0040581837